MFQFHSNNLSAPPAWQVDTSATTQNQPDWTQEIDTAGLAEKNVIPYTEIQNAPNAARAARGENHNLQMHNELPAEVVDAPTTVEEAYQGSMKAILNKNKGNCILATFLVGTENLVTWEGVLYDVGNDYLVIYQDNSDRYVLGDIYSLKFVEFFDSSGQPCAGYRKGVPSHW